MNVCHNNISGDPTVPGFVSQSPRPSCAKVELPILIADDDDYVQSALKQEFESIGFRVLVARNPKRAFDLFVSQTPWIVVAALRKSGGAGLSLLQELREVRPVPVMFYSHFGDVHQAVLAIKAGAQDFFRIPQDVQRLIVTIEEMAVEYAKPPATPGPSVTTPEPARSLSEIRRISLDAERVRYQRLLRECEGNISHVARRAGVSRQTVYNRLRRLGIGY